MTKEYRHIGKNTQRKDAVDIVSGKTVFLDDFKLQDMIVGKALKSPYPHARIISIDTSEAEALMGVRAVISYKNMPEVSQNWRAGLPPHKPMLEDTVRFVGDAVALVAADTMQIVEKALDLIKVEYEILEAVFDAEEAVKDGAPQLYKEFPNNMIPTEINLTDEKFMCSLHRGDVEKAFEECDLVEIGSASYDKIPSPLAPEPPGIVASWDSDEKLTLWATSQGPYYLRMMADIRMPGVKMDVFNFNVGGSYGNKQSMQTTLMFAAALAAAAHKPVKFFLSKAEQLLVHDLRLGTKVNVKVGLKDGILNAVQGEWIMDCGMMSDCGHVQLGVGLGEMQVALGKCRNWDVGTKMVVTNHAPTGVVRGFGGQELKASLLPTVMKAVQKADIDPLEFYKKNFVQTGDEYFWRDGHMWTCRETNYIPAMEAAAERFGWKDKWKGWYKPTRINGSKAVGVGVAIHGNADVGEDNSEAYVRLDPHGYAVMQCAVTESGMGERNNLAKMVAEVLDIPFEDVRITPSNTLVNPDDFGLAGSRGTLTSGTAVTRAAEDAKRQLLDAAAEKFRISAEELDTTDGFVYIKKNPGYRMHWGEIITPFGFTITGIGRYKTNYSKPNFCILFTEVEVDLETGAVKLLDITGGTDVGQVIDPKTLEMQFHGGFGSAAIDTAFIEEHIIDNPTGRMVTSNLIDYKWRTFNEFPNYNQVVLESQPEISRFKAVGFGEIAGAPGPSAVVMAISNAIGKYFCEYPATPNVVLKALGKV